MTETTIAAEDRSSEPLFYYLRVTRKTVLHKVMQIVNDVINEGLNVASLRSINYDFVAHCTYDYGFNIILEAGSEKLMGRIVDQIHIQIPQKDITFER